MDFFTIHIACLIAALLQRTAVTRNTGNTGKTKTQKARSPERYFLEDEFGFYGLIWYNTLMKIMLGRLGSLEAISCAKFTLNEYLHIS